MAAVKTATPTEERWRVVEEIGHFGTWDWDFSTGRMEWSRGSERLHDIAPGTFAGSFEAAIAAAHPDDRTRLRAFAAGLPDHGADSCNYRAALADGSVRWIEMAGKVLCSDSGKSTRAIGVHLDITARREAEEALRGVEQRGLDFANAAPGLIWVAGVDGERTFFNDTWLDFTGRSAQEELGDGWTEGIHPDDLSRCLATYRSAFAAREPFEMEYRVRNRSGDYCWIVDLGRPVFHEERAFVGFIGSAIDITDRRQAVHSVRLLADIGVQLASSLNKDETVQTLAWCLVPRFADWCTVHLAESDGTVWRAAVAHKDPDRLGILNDLQAFSPSHIDGQELIASVIRTGGPVLMAEISEVALEAQARSPEHVALLRQLRLGSSVVVPLKGRGRTLGALAASTERGGRSYSAEDLALAEEIARRAALAVDNAVLYSEAQRREAELHRANDALQFLADAGIELSRSLIPEETLARVADLAVPRFADICLVDLVRPGPSLVRVAASMRDSAYSEPIEQLAGMEEPAREPGDRFGATIAAGRSIFVSEVNDEALHAFARSDQHLDLLRQLRANSAMLVPLTARGQVLGIASFILNQGGRRYTREDLAVAEQLGRRAGMSLDNARLYAQTQDREQELRRANEAKDEFLGLMSHELRTPITVIHGGARVLRTRVLTLDPETRESMLGDIERESERLARMLENLLAMARVELDNELDLEPVLVQHLVARVLASYKEQSSRGSIGVFSHADLESVAAEPAYLEHVLRNLLSNAEKYSPPGSPIEIHLEPTDKGGVAIRVLDRGFGVAPEEAERIFERFYRSDRTSKLAGGAGMGLAVCKRLIEAMSGEIWARPREGGGLEVGFSLLPYEEALP